jgi:DNA-binding MarR family transcriptional regulator
MGARGPDPTAPDVLADRLHSLAIHLLRGLRREDAQSGLTGPRLSALSVVVFGGPLTLSELAAAEQVRKPTMTRLVQALQRDGLVRRVPDPHDRRVVRVRATPRGEALLVQGRARRVNRLAAPIAALSSADRETLHRGADVITRVLAALT